MYLNNKAKATPNSKTAKMPAMTSSTTPSNIASKDTSNPTTSKAAKNQKSNIQISDQDSKQTSCKILKLPLPKPVTFQNLYKLLIRTLDEHIKKDLCIRIGSFQLTGHLVLWKSHVSGKYDDNGKLRTMPIKEGSAKSFKLLYDWITCKVREIPKNDFYEFCRAIDTVEVMDLQYQCLNFIDYCKEHCTYEGPIACVLKPPTLGLGDICRELLKKVLGLCFMCLVASEHFVHLTFEEVVTVLQCTHIAVNTEAEVFLAAVLWLTADWTLRKQFAAEVVGSVNFYASTFIMDSLIRKISYDVRLVVEHPKVQHLMQHAPTMDERKFYSDPRCRYHRCNKCSKRDVQLNYDEFKAYLNYLRTKGPDLSSLAMTGSLPRKSRQWMCCKCAR